MKSWLTAVSICRLELGGLCESRISHHSFRAARSAPRQWTRRGSQIPISRSSTSTRPIQPSTCLALTQILKWTILMAFLFEEKKMERIAENHAAGSSSSSPTNEAMAYFRKRGSKAGPVCFSNNIMVFEMGISVSVEYYGPICYSLLYLFGFLLMYLFKSLNRGG